MPEDTTSRWQLVAKLFSEVSELPSAERAPYLDRHCTDGEIRAEVEQLLAHDEPEASRSFAGLVGAAANGMLAATETTIAQDTLIGAWRVTGVLGRGGMGTVYSVERADGAYRQRAALKVMRGDTPRQDGLRRFLEERDILARLEHPHIARLLDGGNTPQGHPYLVIEFVEGEFITGHCESRRMPLDQRVRLFIDVCSAVQAAHARLVVHRDLKPGNILVTGDGTVKLLDFGIAKLLDPDHVSKTRTGAALLTPEYASPEQVSGQEVTTSTDVYSLGVVLYELLCGAKAHQLTASSSPADIVRVVVTEEPRLPSEASSPDRRRRLEGDLDNIVRMAMRKDPARRYGSVEAMKEDLQRYLDGRTVRARPDTFSYRAMKFVRRNKWSVAAGLLAAASLLSAAVVSRVQAQRAERRFEEVRTLANRFLFDFHDRIRDLPGSTPAREMVVETGKQYLDRLSSEAAGDRSLQADLAEAYDRLGDALGDIFGPSLGKGKESKAAYERAFELRKPLGESDPAMFRAMTANYLRRSDGEYSTGSITKALELAAEGLRRARATGEHFQVYGALIRQGVLFLSSDKVAEAKAALREAVELVDREGANWKERRFARVNALARLARAQKLTNEYEDALTSLKHARVEAEALLKESPTNMRILGILLRIDNEMGDVEGSPFSVRDEHLAESLACFRRALDIALRIQQLDPLSFPALHNVLLESAQVAEGTARLGDVRGLDLLEEVAQRFDEAVARYPSQQALAALRVQAHHAIGWRANDFGQWARGMKAMDRAAAFLREIEAKDKGRVLPHNKTLLMAHRGLAATHLDQRETALADLSVCRAAAAAVPPKFVMAYRNAAWCYHYSGDAELRWGSPARAAEYYREALRLWDEVIAKPTPGKFLPRQRELTRAALAHLP